jgi:hypothetical protein
MHNTKNVIIKQLERLFMTNIIPNTQNQSQTKSNGNGWKGKVVRQESKLFFDFHHRNSLRVVTFLNSLLLSQHLKELWFDRISDREIYQSDGSGFYEI